MTHLLSFENTVLWCNHWKKPPLCSISGLTRWCNQLNSVIFAPETHTKKQANQHGCMPVGWWGQRNWNNEVCGEEKKIFCSGPTREAKTEQKSLVPAWQAQRTSQWTIPFICTLWVPIHLSFNSQQRQWGTSLVSLFTTSWTPACLFLAEQPEYSH